MNDMIRGNDGFVPERLRKEYARLSAMEISQIEAEIPADIHAMSEVRWRLAVKFRVLGEKGADLTAVRREAGKFFNYLMKVAYGQIEPEVLDRFAFKAGLLKRVSALPLPEQKELAKDGSVEIAWFEGGNYTHIRRELVRLTPTQLAQVFDGDHVRNVQEQINWLAQHPPIEAEPARSSPALNHKADLIVPPSSEPTAIPFRMLEIYYKQAKELRVRRKMKQH